MDDQQRAEPHDVSTDDTAFFPIVGIGASAEGLPALARLLENMPPEPGMALLIVLLLPPDHPGAIDALQHHVAGMPVVEASRPLQLRPNHVYVIPPRCRLAMRGSELVADEEEGLPRTPMSIDIFFRTLAQAHGEAAMGALLSGTGTDGLAGLASIREHGGITIAQLPADAEADANGMPPSAIDASMADFMLPAARVPAKLIEMRDIMALIRRGAQQRNPPDDRPLPDAQAYPEEVLDDVLSLLFSRTGHDFRSYRLPTVLRRIARRMQVRGVPGLPAYYRLLQHDLHEPESLLQDLLIGVTNFFRDRDAFAVVEQAILPRILHDKEPGGPLRAWVAACSTGEEAYSLGMLLAEHIEHIAGAPAMQIFATDIDERAIAVARAGRYPDAIAADVPAARLARYFMLEGDQFRVRNLLRDRILFARHDLLHDPAFSNLDLITCRNVLNNLNREVQRHLLEVFHAALNPGGYLFLGGAESAELAPDLFVAVNTRHRLYQAKPPARVPRRLSVLPGSKGMGRNLPYRPAPPEGEERTSRMSPWAEIHQRTVARLAPPSLLVKANGEVMHVSDDAARFLRYSGGEPSLDVLALVLPELRIGLRSAMFQARTTGRRAGSGAIRCKESGKEHVLELFVVPLQDDGENDGMLLVQFQEAAAPPAAPAALAGAAPDPVVRELEEALRRAEDQLRQAVEQAELSSARMGKTIDTLQGTVEGLRTTVEDLEIQCEELQSRNEEQYTVNAELQLRLEDTSQANDDLSNLIASSDIATLFLDPRMRIQRYTPHVSRIFNILPSDVGRPLAHITGTLGATRLSDDIASVFMSLEPIERELRSTDGRDYIVRVHPYRTAYERVDGVVLTFFDISQRRIAEDALRESEARLRAFVTASSDMVYTMSADWSQMLNLQGKNILADTEDPTCGWIEKYIPEQDRPTVLAAIAKAIEAKSTFELEHRVICADGGIGWTFSRAIPLLDDEGNIVEWFGANSDITERKQGEQALRAGERLLAGELEKSRLLQRLGSGLAPETGFFTPAGADQ